MDRPRHLLPLMIGELATPRDRQLAALQRHRTKRRQAGYVSATCWVPQSDLDYLIAAWHFKNRHQLIRAALAHLMCQTPSGIEHPEGQPAPKGVKANPTSKVLYKNTVLDHALSHPADHHAHLTGVVVMKQEIKEAADELVADIRHTLAWAAREHGDEAREALRRMLEEALGDGLKAPGNES